MSVDDCCTCCVDCTAAGCGVVCTEGAWVSFPVDIFGLMLSRRGDHDDTSKPLAGLASLTPQEMEASARHPRSSRYLSFKFVFIADKVVAAEDCF